MNKVTQLIAAVEYYELCFKQSVDKLEEVYYKKLLDQKLKELKKVSNKEYLRSKPTVSLHAVVK